MPTIKIQKQADLVGVVSLVLELVDTKDKAVVVALHGELGAGKTTFVQMLAQSLGVCSKVTSPTFVVMKQYELEIEKNGIDKLVHIDAYRIEDEDEIKVLHFSELLAEPKSLICIEWAENIKGILPEDLIDISIKTTDQDEGREVVIN